MAARADIRAENESMVARGMKYPALGFFIFFSGRLLVLPRALPRPILSGLLEFSLTDAQFNDICACGWLE